MGKRIPAPLNVFLAITVIRALIAIVYTVIGIAQPTTGGAEWAIALFLSLLLIVASAVPVWLLGYRFKRSSVLATILLLGIIAGVGGLTGNAFNKVLAKVKQKFYYCYTLLFITCTEW